MESQNEGSDIPFNLFYFLLLPDQSLYMNDYGTKFQKN